MTGTLLGFLRSVAMWLGVRGDRFQPASDGRRHGWRRARSRRCGARRRRRGGTPRADASRPARRRRRASPARSSRVCRARRTCRPSPLHGPVRTTGRPGAPRSLPPTTMSAGLSRLTRPTIAAAKAATGAFHQLVADGIPGRLAVRDVAGVDLAAARGRAPRQELAPAGDRPPPGRRGPARDRSSTPRRARVPPQPHSGPSQVDQQVTELRLPFRRVPGAAGRGSRSRPRTRSTP